ncbi:SDR family NAD(P)-dependent oxidoreductase [Arthrobacter sp. KBS0703]|uniref:SDR family oxidoreductase n=1 Tax=Arthrobacter sp. KBS0703 TaxID=1955698 RepID=UPI00098FF040|nr:SDR family oxidoreductase [Arthrobacter sp. KBS0703]TSE14456.1 SDR family NAD(P)-dependent oxidoreductase [Arthrobacter sp. KBS0703]
MPSLDGAAVLVTGANGGIGTEFVHQAVARGAAKVYATARTPKDWDDDRVVPLKLDINSPVSRAAAALAAKDVTVLINNAGMYIDGDSILNLSEGQIRETMETNFFGPVLLAQAFAPVLTSHPESVIVDMHSVASWHAWGGAYSAAKAALWSATNSLRLELAPKGTHVVGVHVGYVDTAMAAHATGPKMQPADLVRITFDAVEAGDFEVIADELTSAVKAALSAPIPALYPELIGPASAEIRANVKGEDK